MTGWRADLGNDRGAVSASAKQRVNMATNHTAHDLLTAILDGIDDVETVVAGLERSASEDDLQARDAVERCIECVGAAASRLLAADPRIGGELPLGAIGDVAVDLQRSCRRAAVDLSWSVIGRDLAALKLSSALILDRLGDD